MQERLTKQIADAIHAVLKPLGVAVVIEAQYVSDVSPASVFISSPPLSLQLQLNECCPFVHVCLR